MDKKYLVYAVNAIMLSPTDNLKIYCGQPLRAGTPVPLVEGGCESIDELAENLYRDIGKETHSVYIENAIPDDGENGINGEEGLYIKDIQDPTTVIAHYRKLHDGEMKKLASSLRELILLNFAE